MYQDPVLLLSEGRTFRKYCGFLDLPVGEWQAIQDRLLEEQLELLEGSPWREHSLGGPVVRTAGDLRTEVPLTTYEQYRPCFEDGTLLPMRPYRWVYTSGSNRTHKWVPFTRRALERVVDDLVAAFTLAAADDRGRVAIQEGAFSSMPWNMVPAAMDRCRAW